MSTDFNADVTTLKTNEAKLLDSRGKVARFCYEEQALAGNTDTDVFGVNAYNYNNAQNVPVGSSTVLQLSETVLSKGLRSQGSSFTRMGVNHFFGRVSYNVNKLAKHLNDLLTYFKDFLREGGNIWSPTAIYLAGDTVYCVVTFGKVSYKRVFKCLQSNTDTSPVGSNGNIINPTYWEEISGNVAADLNVRGTGKFQHDVQIEKNLNVRGDLVVEGSTLIADEQTVSTSSDYVILRKNNPSVLGSTEKAGMVIHNYDSDKSAFIGVDSDGIFRISDSVSENTHVYTNISKFGSTYYTGLTQTPATVATGAVVSEDLDELTDCAINNSLYYHNLNSQWFAVSLVSNALYFDNTNPVTDASLIAVLEESTKRTLFYFRTISILEISDTTNQPVLTRAEATDLTDEHLLSWDSANTKVVDSGFSKTILQNILSVQRLTINDTITLNLTYNLIAQITAQSAITITLSDVNLLGLQVIFYNNSEYDQTIVARTVDGNNSNVTLLAGTNCTVEWDGAKWINSSAPAIGATFVQYPNQQPPETVYPCSKWEEVNYNGAFFRSAGGNAQAFDNQTAVQEQGTAKNGLSVSTTNTLKLRNANNDTGTENTTSGMSARATGSLTVSRGGFHVSSQSGNLSASGDCSGTSEWAGAKSTLNINVSHTHSIYLRGSVSTSLSSTDAETRPVNYTVRIYKRIA